MGSEIRFGREMLQNKPLVKNLTIFSRNTIPLYDIILYYIIYLCTHEKSDLCKMYKNGSRFCAKCKKFKKNKKNQKKVLQFAKYLLK